MNRDAVTTGKDIIRELNVVIAGKDIIDELDARRDDCVWLCDEHFEQMEWWKLHDYLDKLLDQYGIHTEGQLQDAAQKGLFEACRIMLNRRRRRPEAILPIVVVFLSSVSPREHLVRGLQRDRGYKPTEEEFLKLAGMVVIESANLRGFIDVG